MSIALISSLPACAQEPAPSANQEPAKTTATRPKPTSPSLKQVADVPGLPRVLLLGDSISMGYTLPVRAKLQGRANVHRPAENGGDTARGVAKLDEWLGIGTIPGKWDVIHFNFGLHDLKYLDKEGNYVSPSKGTVVATPEVYAENLRKIVARLKQTGAKLIFATTTPVPPSTLGRIKDDERRYNAKALEVMKEMGVEVDDLGGYVQNLQAKLPPLPRKPRGKAPQREGDIQQPYNVHFTDEGYSQLAELVVASIQKNLPPAPVAENAPKESPQVVSLSPEGKLIYHPYTPQGDTVLDFSNCGYAGGGVALPFIAAKITLSPDAKSKDDTPRLQNAIDALAKLPLDANGFRGALLLKRGTYRLGDTLRIASSGIVVRGEGKDEKGTVLLGTSRRKYNLFSVTGGASVPLPATTQKITADYVPVNATSVTVADASGFKVGDTVSVTRHSNQAWIHEIKMDRIPSRISRGKESTSQWKPFDLVFDRVVTKIAGNTLTLDAPLGNSIEAKWGGGSVAKYDGSARIERVGIENLFGICEFDRSVKNKYKDQVEMVDEDHVNRFVNFDNAQNVWARDLGTRYLQGVVSLGRGTKHSTVQDSYSVEPISQITGGRRYPFFSNGQLNLWQRLQADEGRHSFVYDSRIPGPNVFLDCQATNENGFSEAHHRWSVGGLYDNVKGNVAVNNRGNQGSGQGWGGANYVVWNGEGTLVLQSPPTAQNFAIGYVGKVAKPRSGPTNAWFVSYGKHVEPRSLYLQQMEDRLGPQAVKNLAKTNYPAGK